MQEKCDRHIDAVIKGHFDRYKQVLVLLGPRQVGKTTLLKRVFPNSSYFLMDNEPTRSAFETYDINTYRQLVKSGPEPVVLDEVHLLSDPGRAAKILYDQMPGIKLIITGSSSFSIKSRATESLAGRKIEYQLFPLSFSEYLYQMNIEPTLTSRLAERLINIPTDEAVHNFNLKAVTDNVLAYGLYPALINTPSDQKYLQNLADSVVFKDLLELKLIENRSTAVSLLTLLAYQIGNMVNYSEIGNRLGIDARTVKKYLDIFESSFIIFRLYPYSTNTRDEIGKTPKVYFYDLGIRNALLNDFSPVNLRGDIGGIFENFVVLEFLKANAYFDLGYKLNYWRLKQGAEMDLILSKKDVLIGLEVKYTHKERGSAFQNRYPQAKVGLVTVANFY